VFDLPLCLIFGGETVVKVSGNGKGGRNLELSLAAALHLHSSKKAFDDSDVQRRISILSAGTDGIDGPTDVAGAVVDNTTIEQALKQGLDPVEYLKNNDSYNFFQQLNGGENFVITGHTGTNVMDIQMVLIQ
jgi:glycerate-2-kinase